MMLGFWGLRVCVFRLRIMPTLLSKDGFRFFFYSNDHLPMHVHVSGNGCEAKFLLDPVIVESCYGFSANDLKKFEKIIIANRADFIQNWTEFFN